VTFVDTRSSITALLVLAALAAAVVATRAHTRAPAAGPAYRQLDDWRALSEGAHRRGPVDAPIEIVVFADFQCDACEQARFVLDAIRARHPDRVAVVYRHYPLRMTRTHADAAANAAECAGEQGRFFAFADALFDRQASIGRVPWTEYAGTAGVPDRARFEECVRAGAFLDVVERDAAAGDSIGVFALPTLIVNGRSFAGALTVADLERLIRDLARAS
jgi:protein-disulfide isomerase